MADCPSPPSYLAPKQQLFYIYYLQSLNAFKSAVRAGYSPKTADKSAYLWVGVSRGKCPKSYRPLFDAIKEARADLIEKIELTPEWVLKQWMSIAAFNPQNYKDPETGEPIPLHLLPPEHAAALREVKTVVTTETRDQTIKGPDGEVIVEGEIVTRRYSGEYKGYKKEEALKFLSLYLGMVENPHNRGNNNQNRLPAKTSESQAIGNVLKKIDGSTRGLPEQVLELPENIKYVNEGED